MIPTSVVQKSGRISGTVRIPNPVSRGRSARWRWENVRRCSAAPSAAWRGPIADLSRWIGATDLL